MTLLPPVNMMTMSQLLDTPWPLVSIWWLGGLLTILVPLAQWSRARSSYYNAYGRYIEYEQEQRAYEEAQDNQNNNNYYYYRACKWWQYQCRRQQNQYAQQYNNNNDNNGQDEEEQDFTTPGWYQFLGGKSEEDRRRQEEMGLSANSHAAIKFVYIWSLLLFVALLAYGTVVILRLMKQQQQQQQSSSSSWSLTTFLAILLVLWIQYALLMLVLLPQGVITTDNRELEDSPYGWYGQFPVLMVYTQFAQLLFCTIITITMGAFWLFCNKYRRGNNNEEAHDSNNDSNNDEYHNAEKLEMT